MASTIEQINLRRKDMKAPQGGSAVVGRASGSSGGGSGNMGHGRRISFSSSVASPPPKADKLGPDKIDTSNDARIKAVLKKYLATLAKEHAYIATRALRAARLDINNRAAQREKEASMPGYVKSKKELAMDEVSPFLHMKGLEKIMTTANSKDIGYDVGKFTFRNYPHKPTVSTPEVKLICKGHIAVSPQSQGLPKMPKYHAYTTLRNNILAEDDEVMRYFPYFGEEAAENDTLDTLNLEEAYVDRTKSMQEDNQRGEKAILYIEFIRDFLKEVGTDLNAISNYLLGDLAAMSGWHKSRIRARDDCLPEDFDFEDAKIALARKKITPVSVKELEKAERVCIVFQEVTDVSLWEVSKRSEESVKSSLAPARLSGGNPGEGMSSSAAGAIAALSGGNPAPYSLESYAALNCLYCYMHECPFHAVSPDDDDPSTTTSLGKKRLQGGIVEVNSDKNFNSIPPSVQTTPGSRKPVFEDEEPCCATCFIKATEEDKAKKSEWTKAQDGLLLSSATVFKDNPRAACLMTCVINKPCYEVKTSSARAQNAVLLITIDPAQIDSELRRRGLLSIQAPTPAVTTTTLPFMNPPPERPQPQNPKTGKRKRTFDTRPAPKPKLKGEYPADCVNTDLSDHRNYYKPCTHTGPCNSSCPCVKAKVMCEKYCNCDADCPRRWRGCNCAASGRACSHNSTCACVKWNRECDPDLCGTCGAAETLSPSNRYNEELAAVCCQNVALQRDVPRRTLLGVSGVSGLGLFIGENIKANQFLGEYKGEVVSHDEAERRGKLYDKRGVSFLFNLNQAQAIDATRAGNKFRFVNHFRKPNCFAKVLFANCTHRIGMYAKRDLVAGEELYFDYGYNNKSVQFIAQEPSFVYVPPTTVTTKKRAPRTGNYNTGTTARTAISKKKSGITVDAKGTTLRTTNNSGGLANRALVNATARGDSTNGTGIARMRTNSEETSSRAGASETRQGTRRTNGNNNTSTNDAGTWDIPDDDDDEEEVSEIAALSEEETGNDNDDISSVVSADSDEEQPDDAEDDDDPDVILAHEEEESSEDEYAPNSRAARARKVARTVGGAGNAGLNGGNGGKRRRVA